MLIRPISEGYYRLGQKVPANFLKSAVLRNHSVSSISTTFKESKEKVAETYGWVAYNLLSTGAFASISYQTGVAIKIAEFIGTQHPLISFAAMIALTLPPLQVTVMIDEKEHPVMKKVALTTANLAMGGGLMSLMGFLGPDVVVPAALITTGVSGSLALAAKHASDEYSLKYQGPLLVGVSGLVASGLCGLAFPGPLGHLAHGISLYGGLFIFSALLVADVQQMHQRANESSYSPIDQSLFIYLDVLNLFTRIAELYHGGRQEHPLPISTSSNEMPPSEANLGSEGFKEDAISDKWKVDEILSSPPDQSTPIEDVPQKDSIGGEDLRGDSEGFFNAVGQAFESVGDVLNDVKDVFK